MASLETSNNFDHFFPQRNSLLLRGILLTICGGLMSVASLMLPNVRIMYQYSSWLPVVALVIVVSGIFSFFDALAWQHSKEFYTNLQIAILDTVVGMVLLTELNKPAEKLILLAASYLMIKGLFRIFAGYVVQFSHFSTAIVGGFISVTMGVFLWQEWPLSTMGFICFCLSIDILTRGWALTRFGIWLRGQFKRQET